MGTGVGEELPEESRIHSPPHKISTELLYLYFVC